MKNHISMPAIWSVAIFAMQLLGANFLFGSNPITDAGKLALQETTQSAGPLMEFDGKIKGMSVSPNEKLAAVILGPTESSSEKALYIKQKLLLLDLTNRKVILEQHFDHGLNDCICFNDSVIIAPSSGRNLLQLDLTLKTIKRVWFSSPIIQLEECGADNFGVISHMELAVFDRDVEELIKVSFDQNIGLFETDHIQNPIEYFNGLVRLNGALFDLTTKKIVALNGPMSFFQADGRKERIGRWTWDYERRPPSSRIDRSSRSFDFWAANLPSRGMASTWDKPLLFNVKTDNFGSNTFQVSLETVSPIEKKLISRKMLGQLRRHLSKDHGWFIRLLAENVYVGAESALFRESLPAKDLATPAHFPIRHSESILHYGAAATFSVGVELNSTTEKPESYNLQTSNVGIDLDRNTGKINLDGTLVWNSFCELIGKKPEDFTPKKVAHYKAMYKQLTGQTTDDIPMAFSIPVTAKFGSTFLKTTYCMLLIVPESEINSAIAKAKSKSSKNGTSRSVKREQDEAARELREQLKEAQQSLQALEQKLNATLGSARSEIEQNTKQVENFKNSIKEIQQQANLVNQEIAKLKEMESKFDKRSKLVEGGLSKYEAEIKGLEEKAKGLKQTAMLTRLIGLLCPGVIVLAGVVGYLILAARKIKI